MHMEKRRVFNILIALFLASGVFSGSALAEICFCGPACSHALQPTGKTKGHDLFHMRCPFNACESCGLENGQTLKAHSTAPQMLLAKMLVTAFILSDFFDAPAINPIFNDFESFSARSAAQSSPIYLQQLSLIC